MLIPSGGVTVACVDDGIVGVLAVAHESEVRWIDQLYIALGYTGRGIGSHLLKHALAALRPPVRLYTFQAKARACPFYERHGFEAIGFGDGSGNEERCPDVLYELGSHPDATASQGQMKPLSRRG